MANWLKGVKGDWIALGVGMVWLPLLMPAAGALRDYGISGRALAHLLSPQNTALLWVGLALEILYVPTTLIALKSVNFRAWLKYPFCLLVFPVFLALMVFNIAWSTEHLSWLLPYGAPRPGIRRGGAAGGFLLATPLPIAMCAVWYLLFLGLDRILPRPTKAQEAGDDGSALYLERRDEAPKIRKAASILVALALVGVALCLIWVIADRADEAERASTSGEQPVTEARIIASNAAATPATRIPARPTTLDPDELIALLRAGGFAELGARLSTYQAAYEAASDGEWELLHAIAVFERIDPDLETAFNAWVAAQPQSYIARAARGAYFYKRAWVFRGARSDRDTSDGRIAAMQELFKRATDDLLASRSLSSRPQVSDRYLVGIAMEQGDRAAPRRIYLEAVRGDPENYGATRAYLNTLRPEWGGSLDAMHAFVEHTAAAVQTEKQRAVANYLEASLLGYLGLHYYRAHEYQRALRLYDEALAKAEDSIVLARRAQLLMQLKRADEALRDVERVLELDPTSADAFESRGILREQRKQVPQALEDYRSAAAYGSTYAMQRLGLTYLHGNGVRKDYREAAKWLELGAGFGEHRAQNYLGWMYAEGIGVPRDGKRALSLWYASAEQGNEEARRYLDGIPWYWRARYKIAALWPK
jgi:TPR repeat protein